MVYNKLLIGSILKIQFCVVHSTERVQLGQVKQSSSVVSSTRGSRAPVVSVHSLEIVGD